MIKFCLHSSWHLYSFRPAGESTRSDKWGQMSDRSSDNLDENVLTHVWRKKLVPLGGFKRVWDILQHFCTSWCTKRMLSFSVQAKMWANSISCSLKAGQRPTCGNSSACTTIYIYRHLLSEWSLASVTQDSRNFLTNKSSVWLYCSYVSLLLLWFLSFDGETVSWPKKLT